MMFLGRTVLVCGAILTMFGAVACGTGGGGSQSPSPASETPVSGGTPAPLAEPTVTGDVVNYPAKGYRARIPSGWNFQPNAVQAEEFAPDYLIRPETVDGVQANIIITCEQLVGDAKQLTLDQFVDNKTTRAKGLGATDVSELPVTTVAGAPARVLQYSRVLNNTPILRRDMLFLHDDCAWQLAYTASPGSADRLQPDVDAFARSFELIPRF